MGSPLNVTGNLIQFGGTSKNVSAGCVSSSICAQVRRGPSNAWKLGILKRCTDDLWYHWKKLQWQRTGPTRKLYKIMIIETDRRQTLKVFGKRHTLKTEKGRQERHKVPSHQQLQRSRGNDASPGVLGFSSADSFSTRAANSRPLENLIKKQGKSVSFCAKLKLETCSKMYVSVPFCKVIDVDIAVDSDVDVKSYGKIFQVTWLHGGLVGPGAGIYHRTSPVAQSSPFLFCFIHLFHQKLLKTPHVFASANSTRKILSAGMGMHAKLTYWKSTQILLTPRMMCFRRGFGSMQTLTKAIIAMSSAMEWRCENMGIDLCDEFELVLYVFPTWLIFDWWSLGLQENRKSKL